MLPITTYKNSLLTSPNLSSSTKYQGSPTYVAPTKPKITTVPTGQSGTLYGNLNLSNTPSSAWQTAGSNMAIGANGIPVKKPTVTPTNPSNTGTVKTTASPAQQTYQQRLAELTKGVQDVQSGLNEYKASKSTPEEEYKNSAEYKAYLKYMREQQNPTEATNTANQRAEALKVLADVQKRKEEADTEARRRYEELLDKSGGTRAAAEQGAGLDRRRSNQELADIALQESAAARTAGVYDDIYQNEQAQNRPLTIEEATILGVPFGTTMSQATALGKIPTESGASTEGVASLAQMVMNGEMDMSAVPTEMRGAVADAVAAGGGVINQAGVISPYQQERITRNINAVDNLYSRVGPWTTGFGALLDVIPSSDAKDFAADLAELKANIAFGELTAMREASKTGGALGAVSEKELALLESALGSLDTKQSAANFQKNLTKIKDSINRWVEAANQYSGAGGGESVTLQDGTTIYTNW